MHSKIDITSLKAKALLFRREILEILCRAGSGHPGGSLSAVEIMISLYYSQMEHRPLEPNWEGRDRLIISKGHCTPVVYVTLANCGYFPKTELVNFRKLGSPLQGHVHVKTPGVEFNTGSLGHGLSVANGLALGAKMLKKKFRTYCLLGDGEIQEGSVWEAAMTASHYNWIMSARLLIIIKSRKMVQPTRLKILNPWLLNGKVLVGVLWKWMAMISKNCWPLLPLSKK